MFIDRDDLTKLKINANKVANRESDKREFKLKFDKNDIWRYAKTIVAFANKDGGIIFFGIKDKPRTLIGDNENINENNIGQFLISYFAPEIELEFGEKYENNIRYHYILISSSKYKPVICKKEFINKKINKEKEETLLREGAIYYRYNSSTMEIKYSELHNMINKKRDEIFSSLIDNIKLTKKIGYNNVAMMRIEDIEKNNERASVYITKETAKSLNWIKEGKFSEDENSNKAFYVKQEVSIKKGVVVYSDPALTHPLIQKDFIKKVKIKSNYCLNELLSDVGIVKKDGSNDEKYYLTGSNGKNK